MQVEKNFEVACDRDHAVDVICREETLVALFPEAKSEIVSREGDRVSAQMHYSALGREGVATFHFDYLMDGNVRFEKVCDGNVWKQLRGEVTFEEAGSRCRVSIEMEGKTKGLVPEFTIRGPMNEQIDQMAEALQRRIEDD